MYHHHSQQQGSQPYSNGPRPPHHQPPQNQHQNRSSSDMRSQVVDFQFPRPTQLPDELESALAIRGARDMDHRLIEHMSQPSQHQNQSSASAISQHGSYGSNPITITSDTQPGHQQGVDWSSYQPPTKLFASPPPSASHPSQQQQGPQQQSQSNHAGTSIPNWTASVSGSPSPQARHSHGGSGDGQGLYTPESAGSILASFGLSNDDLEVLSHYPDDQLTPDTLPFILRDIQINKSNNQKTVTSSSASSLSCTIHDMPLPASRSSTLTRSCSPEVPSLLTVTQTAGKVIDYGHASRAKDESSTRETFKREQLSSERTVKMYPSSPSSSSVQKADKAERRQVPRLEHKESSKHGDQDYRRANSDHRKNNLSPGREFPPTSKSRNQDHDYRHHRPKLRPSSETRSEASSRRSLSSSSGSKPQSSNKKLPTPTMRNDFSAVSPKVFPHTCSLCDIQCDQEKDWIDHINTVNHTAARRDLRNKYPDWKPHLLSRSGQYGSRSLRDPKDHSPSHSMSRSLSYSPSPSPPHSRHRVGPHPHRVGPHPHRPHGRPYSPHHHPHDYRYSGGLSRSGVKRPHDYSTSRHPFSPTVGQSSKHGRLQSPTKTVKSVTKPGTKTTKTSVKPPPAKKKKKIVTQASQDSSVADRLVFLTGIPKDASEQEVTDLVGSFGKINNVILMPCSEEEVDKGNWQKASVCMVKAEDAQALANSTDLLIRDQRITASIAKKPEAGPSPDANNSKPAAGQDNSGGETDQKTSDEKSMVLITGLPESGWSESDIIKLVQPFGTPSDIILAAEIGKVLVTVSDMEIAQEMVKVNTFIPMKINDCELNMSHLKQCVGLDTPVALYNVLMGKEDPLESSVPVGWSSLLVISNVPNTPSGSSEVQKLVRRFGTVIKTLVLSSVVICEMATAAMALSVYKRFQTFPCIIQNNPLFFSRKPDPKVNTQTKVIAAYLDSSEETPANGKNSQMAAAAEGEESTHKEDSETPQEDMNTEKDENKSTEKTAGKDASLGESRSKGGKISKDDLQNAVSDSLAAPDVKPDVKPEAKLETETKGTSATEDVVETAEEEKGVRASKAENDSPAIVEVKPTSSDSKADSQEDTAAPELPKVTQEMVDALLVECRTRTAGLRTNISASTNGEQREPQMETEQNEKPAGKTKETARTDTEEELRQDKERKEREAKKQKEARERERREREKRAWEKEKAKKERERDERARRERERREEERRQWERRERARRDRKRAYDEEMVSSSNRVEGNTASSGRDDPSDISDAKNKTVEEEEFHEFPFNMSDFVTVDEVGDVTDLPGSPSPIVPMETTEGREDPATSFQKETPQDTHMDVTTSHTVATLRESDEHTSDSEPVTVSTSESADSVLSSELIVGVTPTPALQSDSSPRQTPVPACRAEAPPTDTTLTTALGATMDFEDPPTSATPASAAPADTHSPVTVTAQSEEEEDSGLSKTKIKVADKPAERKKMQDDGNKEAESPAVETGKLETSDDQTHTEAEITENKLKTETPMSTDSSLPPFNPSNPVGMEFLVPKTGFFCKVCNRFFSGSKEAEINHCRTLKHYNNLQKYLQTTKMVNVTA